MEKDKRHTNMMCPNASKNFSLYFVATINQSECDVLAGLQGKKSNVWINTKDFLKKIDKSKLEVIMLWILQDEAFDF